MLKDEVTLGKLKLKLLTSPIFGGTRPLCEASKTRSSNVVLKARRKKGQKAFGMFDVYMGYEIYDI